MIEGGPAASAGLQSGDVITMIGTTTISSRDDISALSKNYKAGDTVTVTFVRSGQVQTTELTFGSTTELAGTAEQQPAQQDQNANGSYGYGGTMDDFFDQFFGGGQADTRRIFRQSVCVLFSFLFSPFLSMGKRPDGLPIRPLVACRKGGLCHFFE